ncbi:Spy/CpxP family protein refolding chaperone [Persephonella sp.]
MKFFQVLLVILITAVSVNAQTEESSVSESSNTQTLSITIDQIGNDSWMDGAFLVKRYNFLPVLKKYRNELGLTEEQLQAVNTFYSKYYPKMEELARSIQEKEKELNDLVINGGDSKRIRDLIVEIAKEKAELTVYNIKEVRTIQNALTKEQFEKLKNLAQQEVI